MLNSRLEQILDTEIIARHRLGGGCIACVEKLETVSGNRYILKSGGVQGMYLKEANGLKEIAKSKSISVPEVLSVGDDFLLLSFIEPGIKTKEFYLHFAYNYAQMHRYTGEQFGFYEDNYIGSTPQKNNAAKEEANDWITFFFNKRLLYQFKLAERNNYVKQDMRKAFLTLEEKIERIIGSSAEAPSLLHGDLWGGNYLVGSEGKAVLIDPAVYYGHREADLAMTRLFGGFPPEFYEHYNAFFPLQEGWEYRENIYRLYHILNHLNIFGPSYYNEALNLMLFYQ